MTVIKRMHSTMRIYLMIATAILVLALLLLIALPFMLSPIFSVVTALDSSLIVNPKSFAVTIALVLLVGFLPVLILGSTLYAYIDGILARKNGIADSPHAR